MALSYYRIRHSIPGRMRVKSLLMKKDPARCTTVTDALKKMRGIVAVTSNPVVGSAVILYWGVQNDSKLSPVFWL